MTSCVYLRSSMEDPEGGEKVSRLLGDLGSSLPVADFEIGSSDEESDASEGSLKVFTRSQHLEEVGFTSNDQVLCDAYTVATGGCEQSDGSGVESLAQRDGSPFLEEGEAVTSKRKDIAEMCAAEIQPDPVKIQPDPVKIQPDPVRIQPDPVRIQPDPVRIQPDPVRIQPDPVRIQPDPVRIQPDPVRIQPDPVEIRPDPVEIQPDPCGEEMKWEQFKSEFTDTLESSEQHIEEETRLGTQGAEDVRSLRQQLLIDAITALHSETEGNQAGTHSATEHVKAEQIQESPESRSTVDNHSEEGVASKDMTRLSSYPSGSNDALSLRQTGILSLRRLETIHESKLDRMLELVESGTQPEAVQGESPIVDSRGQGRNVPHPPLVWDTNGETGSEVLMKELEQLSKEQSKQTVSTATSTSTDTKDTQRAPTGHQVLDTLGGERPTVFLDLRPSQQEQEEDLPATISPSAQRLLALRGGTQEGSSSDSEDSDDPYAWIAQRKQLNVNPVNHQSNKPVSPLSTNHSSWRELAQQNSNPQNTTRNECTKWQDKPQSTARPTTKGTSATPDETSPASLQTEQARVATQGELSSSVSSVDSTHASSGNGVTMTTTHRQRNTDSLTLSESDTPDVAQQGKFTTPKLAVTSPTKGKRASAKKHAKKAKKKLKSNQDLTKAGSSGVKGQGKRPQRLRHDSYTTSSDEEPVKREALAVTIPPPVERGPENEVEDRGMDMEKFKLQLQRKIQSKKPLSQFETPATDCVFHEDVSFEPLLTSSDPTMRTDALLVLPLSEQGLTLLPEIFSELDMATQQIFHSLVLTWLTTIVASSPQVKGDCPSQNENGKEPSLAHNESIPFRITAMQQTIFDGTIAVIMGVALERREGATYSSNSHCPHTSDTNQVEHFKSTPTVQEIEQFLQHTTFSTALEYLFREDTLQEYISATSQASLEHLFHLPLNAVFSVHGDHTPLMTPVSFYWHSLYNPSCLPSNESLKPHAKLQTTVTTISQQSLSMVALVFSIFHSIHVSGLDIAGLRVVFREATSSIDMTSSDTAPRELTLALAIRGPDAIFRWMDVVGPEDSALAKVTDPQSLSARFGSLKRELLHCVRTPYRATAALAKWFGGRACLKTGIVLGVSDARTRSERRKRQRVRFSESESEDSLPSPLPDITFPPLISNRPLLIAPCYSKILLVISPHIPPSCYATVLASCSHLGFDIFGVKRIRLNSKRATALNISPFFITHFTPSSTPPSPSVVDFVAHPLGAEHGQNAPPLPSVLLLLGRENALKHSVTLRDNILSDLSHSLKLNQFSLAINLTDTPHTIIHTTEYAEEVLKVIGTFSFTTINNTSTQPQLVTEGRDIGGPREEFCFIAITQSNGLQRAMELLNCFFHIQPIHNCDDPMITTELGNSLTPSGGVEEFGRFELLGLKLVPRLSRFHAKQLCPFSQDDPLYQSSVQSLSDAPALLVVFRGIDCNRRLRKILPQASKSIFHTAASSERKLQVIISDNVGEAFSLTSTFFTDKELFIDAENWVLASYVPPAWLHDCNLLQSFLKAPELLYSVFMVNSTQMNLLVKVLEKLSRSEFSFVGLTLHFIDKETVIEDLASGSQVEERWFVVCVQRVNAVWYLEQQLRPFVLSSTTYKQALSYAHSFNSAMKDIKQYFSRGLCCQPTAITKQYNIPCPLCDDNGNIAAMGCLCPPDGKTTNSPLLETTCIILPSLFFQQHDKSQPSFISALELVSQAGFDVLGLRMVFFSEELATTLCHCFSEEYKVEELCGGPSLMMLLRRDNAASCFHSILKSTIQPSFRGDVEQLDKLLAKMIVPRSLVEARQVLQVLEIEE